MSQAQVKAVRRRLRTANRHKRKVPIKEAFTAKPEKKRKKKR